MCKGHLTFSKKGYLLMNRLSARVLLLIFPSLWGCPLWAQSPAPHVQAAKARSKSSAAKVAPIARQQLFGSIPISTRSEEARKFVEISLDRYENHIVDGAVLNARKAINRDPQFALGYAALSLASLGSIPDAAALRRAKALLTHTTPDERLLIHWMTSISDRDLLPAITAMNDLLKRYPDNKHVLYIIADWLYFQQDYERSRQMLETVRHLDPDFPPALNLLGYSYIQTGTPDLEKAVASVQRYAEVQPKSPNPQDSLGEIFRMAGDDQSSLEHYSAALNIDPTSTPSSVMPKFSRNLPIPRTLSAKSSVWPVTTKVLSNTIPPLSTLTPHILRHTTVSATPPRSWEITSGPALNTMTPSPSPATRVIVRTANSRRLSSIFGKDRPRKGMRLSMRSTKKRAVRTNPIRNLNSVSAALS